MLVTSVSQRDYKHACSDQHNLLLWKDTSNQTKALEITEPHDLAVWETPTASVHNQHGVTK